MIQVHDFRLLNGEGKQVSIVEDGGEITHVILGFDIHMTVEEVSELYMRVMEFDPEEGL
jgi:hypothetical protein